MAEMSEIAICKHFGMTRTPLLCHTINDRLWPIWARCADRGSIYTDNVYCRSVIESRPTRESAVKHSDCLILLLQLQLQYRPIPVCLSPEQQLLSYVWYCWFFCDED